MELHCSNLFLVNFKDLSSGAAELQLALFHGAAWLQPTTLFQCSMESQGSNYLHVTFVTFWFEDFIDNFILMILRLFWWIDILSNFTILRHWFHGVYLKLLTFIVIYRTVAMWTAKNKPGWGSRRFQNDNCKRQDTRSERCDELLKTNLGGVWQAAALYWTAVVGDTYEWACHDLPPSERDHHKTVKVVILDS